MPLGRGGTKAAKMVQKRPARCESPALRERRSSSAVKRRPAASSRVQKRKTGAKTAKRVQAKGLKSKPQRSQRRPEYKTGYERTPPKMRALLKACSDRDLLAATLAWAALGAPSLRGVLAYWMDDKYHHKERPHLSAVDLVIGNLSDPDEIPSLVAGRTQRKNAKIIKLLQGAGSRLTQEGFESIAGFCSMTHDGQDPSLDGLVDLAFVGFSSLDGWVRQGLRLDGLDLADVAGPNYEEEDYPRSFFADFLLEVGNSEGVRMIQEHCKRWIQAGVQIWPFCGPHKVSPSVPPCTSGATRRQLDVARLLWQDGNDQESEDSTEGETYDNEGDGKLHWSKSDKDKLITGLWAACEEHRRNSAWWRRGTLLMYCRRGSLRAKGLAAFLQRIDQAAPELLMSVLKFV